MQGLEEKIKLVEDALAQPEIYQAENRQHMEELSRQRAELGDQLVDAEEAWLNKSDDLERMASDLE